MSGAVLKYDPPLGANYWTCGATAPRLPEFVAARPSWRERIQLRWVRRSCERRPS
jgi:hypothetical protein